MAFTSDLPAHFAHLFRNLGRPELALGRVVYGASGLARVQLDAGVTLTCGARRDTETPPPITGDWVADLMEALDPHGLACFPVSWAGDATSENWMDIGREFTERWHHQAQIRDAVGAARLLEPRWLDPLLDISVRALPVAYAGFDAPEGTMVSLIVRGASSPGWTLERHAGRWRLLSGLPDATDASLTLEADVAWRLFYNALPPGAPERSTELRGDRRLIDPMLAARSVVL